MEAGERAEDVVELRLARGQQAVRTALTDEARRQISIARTVAALAAVRQAAATQDRPAMLAALAPSPAALPRRGNANTLSLMVPPGTALARAAQPENFGDDISARRPDISRAIRGRRDNAVIGAVSVGTVCNATQLERARTASRANAT